MTLAAGSTTFGTFIGNGFDACNAPSANAMQAWMKSSPYRAVNIYIGGAMRACANGNLTAAWVSTVRAMGWRLIPTYVGLQAPCTSFSGRFSVDDATAESQGSQAADDAVAQSQSLGLPAGSPLYFDMESYSRSAAGCSSAVLSFLAGWTKELHAEGWASGAYGSVSSLVTDLAAQSGTSYPQPDDLWFANWNNLDSAYGDPYVPDGAWTGHRRIHQWHGGRTETYGGYSINLDGDGVDGQVVGPPGGDCVSFASETHGPDGCDGAFSLSGPLQYWRFGSPDGQQQSTRWTYGNGTNEANGATWAPHLSAGVYDLSAWIPVAHSGAKVHYTITDDSGAHSVYVDQSAHRGGWVPLGQYSTGLTGTITAHAGDDAPTGSVIGVDALTFHFVHAIDVNPPSGSITSPATGAFTRPGASVMLSGDFSDDVYVTKVVFSVDDGSGNWLAAGTDVHNGNGIFAVNWPERYSSGSVVSVRADVYDTAGHVTTVSTPDVLTVDATPPSAAMTGPRWPFTLGSRTRLAWRGTDTGSGIATWDVRGQWSTATGWTSRWHRVRSGLTTLGATYGGLRMGWEYCFEVRAHDRVGNLSHWSTPRCVARALDDRALAVSTAGWWRPYHVRRYYRATYTSSNRYNDRLTRSSVSASRVFLLATQCPRCGKVRLYLAGRYIGTINLYAPSWHTHRFVAMRAFPRRTGRLTVRTVTNRKLVRIDGIVIARA